LAVISSTRDPIDQDWSTAAEQGVEIDFAQVGEIHAHTQMNVISHDA
jgi:hypothetical protein